MSGIVGVCGWGDADALRRMTARLAHRGPDGGGEWDQTLPDGTTFGLGHRRFAVTDLVTPLRTPMGSDDGQVWVTWDGALYNAPDLRAELEAKGHRFRTQSHIEVVLRLVRDCGCDAVSRLDGAFAFAAVDLRPDPPNAPPGRGPLVLLARDPFGVKPLYYVREGARLAFASEVKALLDLPGFTPRLNLSALHRYLTLRYVPDPDTLFEGVAKLPAGHFATFRDGDLRTRCYWSPVVPPQLKAWGRSEAQVLEGIRARLRVSVRKQATNEVRTGLLLSAGVDSAAVLASAVDAGVPPSQTFTLRFPGQPSGDRDASAIAARAAAHFGVPHREIVAEADLAALLPRLAWQMDEPIADPAAVALQLLCAAAKSDAKVLLTGIGADELFAGDRKHTAFRLAARYRRIPPLLRRRVIEPFVRSLPTFRGSALAGPVRRGKQMVRTGSLPQEEAFLMEGTYLDDGEKTLLYTPSLREQLDDQDPYTAERAYLDDVHEADFINRMLYLDLKSALSGQTLTMADKTGMASSVEVRAPFLDRDLAGFAFTEVPPDWKVTDDDRPRTKDVLRRALRGIVPDEVIAAPRTGFNVPLERWLAHDLRALVGDLLSADRVEHRALFNPGSVATLVKEHYDGRRDWSNQIWQLLTLELWQREFMDR